MATLSFFLQGKMATLFSFFLLGLGVGVRPSGHWPAQPTHCISERPVGIGVPKHRQKWHDMTPVPELTSPPLTLNAKTTLASSPRPYGVFLSSWCQLFRDAT